MSQPTDGRAIQLSASLDHVAVARDFVADIARQVPLDTQQIYDLELVVTEALTNVIEHACQGDLEADVRLAVSQRDDEFTIVISHDGLGFDPSAHADPHMPSYLAERRVGGLGLYLIKKLMDEVEYSTDARGKQVIRMVKKHPTGLLPEGEL